MNTDDVMVDTWLSLARDFAISLEMPTLCKDQGDLLKKDVKTFRACHFPGRMQASPALHKRIYQLESFLKRYIFQTDLYTKEELEQKANTDFADFQLSLASSWAPYKSSTYMVIQRARRIVTNILGTYDPDEHKMHCRFGKRAAVDVPAHEAYLDTKVDVLSGSRGHGDWFLDSYINTDLTLLLAHVSMRGGLEASVLGEEKHSLACNCTSYLTLVNVPKKYNTLRSIMPNTVLGGFYTLGLGRLIELRLRDTGLDIRKLQDEHKRLARNASKTRHLVTLDLSKASENFKSSIINRLCPRAWYNALKLGRIKYAQVGGKLTYLESFMAMGVGFTFPLQTLLFYAIIRAVAELMDVKGTISVYGDDCIYPRRIHKYVLRVFSDLGFKANADKTFDVHYFRESCGGDYYHGVDVRPYSPDMQSSVLYGAKAEGFLYKLLNGLLRRWDIAEIPQTYRRLLNRIAATCGRIYQVPPSFPDESGVKVDCIQDAWYEPWSPVLWSNVEQNYVFAYLRKQWKARVVRSCYPYYWNALRSSSLIEESAWTPWDESPAEALVWLSTKPKSYYRSRITKERLLRMVAVVPSKVSQRYTPGRAVASLGLWYATPVVA